MLHTFLKYEIKNWGQWCKFRHVGQNIKILASGQERSSEMHFLSINSYNFANRLVNIQFSSPFSQGRDPSFEYTWGAKFGWNWHSGSGEVNCWICSMIFSIIDYFRYFVIICPRKREWPFIWRNSISLHLRMLFARFVWNWSSG